MLLCPSFVTSSRLGPNIAAGTFFLHTIFPVRSTYKCVCVCLHTHTHTHTHKENLKEEALDPNIWRTRFGRGNGPVPRQTTERMYNILYVVSSLCAGVHWVHHIVYQKTGEDNRPWKLFHANFRVVGRFMDGLMKSRRITSDVIQYQIFGCIW